jgi:hypothetical protein
MIDPTATAAAAPPAPRDEDVVASSGESVSETATASGTNVAEQLRSRVVREARRETWFVVNEGDEDLATIPIDLREDAALRRVEVNGEAAEFSAGEQQVLVRPRRILRAGAGTIVVLHFR